jgi:predicted O-methyltransferase YrrM
MSDLILTTQVRHQVPSVCCSIDNNVTSDYLFDLILTAIATAHKTPIEDINDTISDSVFYNIFPGEHYRLLNGIVKYMKPKVVVEIGTFTGMGTKSLAQSIGKGIVHTFDITPWHEFVTHLTVEQFQSNKISQHLSDLSIAEEFKKHFDLLNSADIIFIDAPKDGIFEYEFVPMLQQLDGKEGKILIFDDIRFLNTIDMWNRIKSPKLDVTSFGHFTGTGIVDISKSLQYD